MKKANDDLRWDEPAAMWETFSRTTSVCYKRSIQGLFWALLIPSLAILMILLLSATLIAAKLHWMSVCEYPIQQLPHSIIVSLKGSRSMVVFPPQEAVSGLWLPPASMRQKALGLSCGPAGRGGQPVTWKWLLTLWSKGQHLASPATGHAGSHALPCWRLTEVAGQSKGKPHVVTFLRMSLSMSVPPVTAFRSARLVQTRGVGACVYFYPVLLRFSDSCLF